MLIPCFRCGKEINTPDNTNADYIMAEDTITREPRQVLVALLENEATRAKNLLMSEVDEKGIRIHPEVSIADSDYDSIEIPCIEAKESVRDLVKVIIEVRDKDIQKTGIACPDCYKETDFVIWGSR